MTSRKCYTITFGEVAENHHGMQKIGSLHEKGYTLEQILKIKSLLKTEGVRSQVYALHNYVTECGASEAFLLVIRKGVQHILKTEGTVELMAENDELDMDKRAFMKGRVVQKRARWNLCFADEEQVPDYEKGKGRIVSWRQVPLVQKIREKIAEWTEDELLNGEANYYYDIDKCGIGFHGDAERRKVFACRMGEPMPLFFQWFQDSQPIGPRLRVNLEDGDMYIMSEKTVGFDWLKKKIPTLRHATGCDKFTVI
jgi:hypothetical protein